MENQNATKAIKRKTPKKGEWGPTKKGSPRENITLGVIVPVDLNYSLELVADTYQKSKSTLIRQIIEYFFIKHGMPISTPFVHPLGTHHPEGATIPLDWDAIEKSRKLREKEEKLIREEKKKSQRK